MTVEIVFETHSLTTDNEAGIATGRRQGELSEEGWVYELAAAVKSTASRSDET